MLRYTFDAAATAAHYEYNNGKGNFGPEYTVIYRGSAPFHYEETLEGQKGEVCFSSAYVFIDCRKVDGAYITVVKSAVNDFTVKDIVKAKRLECGIETVYREEWYGDPQKPRHARILPIEPVLEKLEVFGELHNLKLPDPFFIKAGKREEYFQGLGDVKEPEGIAAAAEEIPTDGDIQYSDDKRRIAVPNSAIVYFADWKWQPTCIHAPAKTAQWIQLLSLNLKNPGRGGGGGVGGNGTP